jgi:predicted permease
LPEEDPVFQDLRHAVRLLLQNKGWTLVVALSIALGIGANTALFGAVNGLLLQTIPVDRPDTLVRFGYFGKNDMGNDFNEYDFSGTDAHGQNIRGTFSYPVAQQLMQQGLQTMSGVIAGAPIGQLNVVFDGHADVARGFVATGNFYQVLGVPALIGRTLRPDDDAASAAGAAVLSESYWKRRFGGDAGVLGKVVFANRVALTIVGVTPARFTGIQRPAGTAPDITVPLAFEPQLDDFKALDKPTAWWLQVIGRLKPSVTAAQVAGSLNGVFQATAQARWTEMVAGLSEAERASSPYRERSAVPQLLVTSARRGMFETNARDTQSLTLLSAVVVLLLLIVCANVANLLLARSSARRKEISVRLSLGASRQRLIRQLLTESVLLAAVGGVGGLLVGYWSRQLVPLAVGAATFDWRLLAFVTSLTLVTGILFGLAPALRATQIDVSSALKETGRSTSASRTRLSKALLVAQVALSLVLLIGAGLFLETLWNLRRVDVGFDTSNLLMFRINPQLMHYDNPRTIGLYRDLQDRLARVPGVKSVSASQPPLLSGSVSGTDIFIEGHAYARAQSSYETTRQRGNNMNQVRVTPSFFQTLGIPLVAGRLLTERDDERAPKVVVINEAAVRHYFAPGENPIGMRFGSRPESRTETEIVGIVRDVKYNSVRDPAPPTLYAPLRQRCCPGVAFEVRTAVDPATLANTVRDAIREIDPNLPVTNTTTQAEQLEGRLAQEKLFAQAYTLFGLLALALASIGLFGLMSYSVARRTNEIGIRMALGARRGDVVSLVMKESLAMVASGIGIGLAAAMVAGRFVAALLFGLPPGDLPTIALAVSLMVAVSMLAGYLPARRAARVDPMVALRCE